MEEGIIMIDFEGRVYCFIALCFIMGMLIFTGQIESYNYLMNISLGLLAGIILPTNGIVQVTKGVIDGRN
jgi:hypothetical protein